MWGAGSPAHLVLTQVFPGTSCMAFSLEPADLEGLHWDHPP